MMLSVSAQVAGFLDPPTFVVPQVILFLVLRRPETPTVSLLDILTTSVL